MFAPRTSEELPPVETQPLLKPIPANNMGKLCIIAVVSGLVMSWCCLDTWNRNVSTQLFEIGDLQKLSLDPLTGLIVADDTHLESFTFPLTLVFLQLVFMGLVFLLLFALFDKQPMHSLRMAWAKLCDWRSVMLPPTHMCSMVGIQALVLPAKMMPLTVFAASRALEVPAAAGLRTWILGAPFGRNTMKACGTLFVATGLLFYSYTRIAECVCIWSGFGVALTGLALYMIYTFLTVMPAANAVYQESVLVHLQTQPFLLLALMNIFASLLFAPIMLLVHIVGWEDVGQAVRVLMGYQEVYMLVLWLCMQMVAISLVSTVLICLVDSFWLVALRSLRVMYWWLQQLYMFYGAHPDTMVSLARPQVSFWSFVMFCGVGLVAVAAYNDRRADDGESPNSMPKRQSTSTSVPRLSRSQA